MSSTLEPEIQRSGRVRGCVRWDAIVPGSDEQNPVVFFIIFLKRNTSKRHRMHRHAANYVVWVYLSVFLEIDRPSSPSFENGQAFDFDQK